MADITYYEDGYIAQGYHVYTADAMIILGDYIESNYLVDDYFTFTGSKATVVCEGSRLTVIEVESAMSVSASTSITGSKDARTDVTLVSIANISSQADRLRGIDSTITSTFTQTSSATRIRTTSTDFSSIATQLTVAFQNATGTILMEPTATLTALVGVIKQARISSPIGVDADNEATNTRSPYLRFGTDNTPTPLDGYVSVSNSVNQTGKFVMSMWMIKPMGYVFDADPNRDWYSSFANEQINNNSIEVTTESDAPSFYYRGNTGYVKWPLGPSPRLETLKDYSHYLLSVDITKSTNAQKYRLFKDGAEITGGEVHQLGGVGAGQSDTVITTPFDIKITAFDQYQLMMNTTGGPYKIDPRDGNGGGYGDSNGQKADRSGLTQFWWDYDAASYDIDNAAYRAKFYDGNYRDLGDQGTATGLSRPKHYVRLLNYQDIEEGGTKQSVQAQWNWEKLRVYSSSGSNPVIDLLIAENYTATTDQNSLGILQGIRAAFSLVVDSVNVLEVTSVPQAVFTLSAVIGRRQNAAVSLASQAQLSATANMVASAQSQQAAACSLTADYTRTRSFSSDLNTSLSLSATAIKIRQLAAAFTSTTQLSADVGETTELAAVMATAATLELAAIRLRDHTATLTAQAQLAARIDDRLRDQSAALASTLSLICDARTLEGVDSLMASQFAITVNTEVVKVAGAGLTAQFTQSTQVFRVAVGSAYLQVQAFELTQGDVINFAPELIFRVPAESRTRRVLPENRVYGIDSESRTRRVLAESRVLSIEQETELNII